MDLIAHVIYGIIIFGLRPEVVLGSMIFDLAYIPACISIISGKGLKHFSKLVKLGFRFHSIFTIPIPSLIAYLATHSTIALRFMLSSTLHLIFDIPLHGVMGPYTLWPILDRRWPKGVTSWSKPNVIIGYYTILILIIIVKVIFGFGLLKPICPI